MKASAETAAFMIKRYGARHIAMARASEYEVEARVEGHAAATLYWREVLEALMDVGKEQS